MRSEGRSAAGTVLYSPIILRAILRRKSVGVKDHFPITILHFRITILRIGAGRGNPGLGRGRMRVSHREPL